MCSGIHVLHTERYRTKVAGYAPSPSLRGNFVNIITLTRIIIESAERLPVTEHAHTFNVANGHCRGPLLFHQ